MYIEPLQALQATQRPAPQPAAAPSVLVAGATGTLGDEVLMRLVTNPKFGLVRVLAREAVRPGLRGVEAVVVPAGSPADWAPVTGVGGAIGVVLFEPARNFNDRERAFFTPEPGQLVEVARWMRASGASTLAVVLPHAQGRLPEALKRGLASLDEHTVATLGFERLLFIRTAARPQDEPGLALLPSLARWMLSITKYMVPTSEQPVRAAKVAELLAAALQCAPPGIHVAAPELVWRAAQGDAGEAARRWLCP